MKKLLLAIIVSTLTLCTMSQTRRELYNAAQYFSDLSYTALKPGIKAREIKNIQNSALRAAAEQMLKNQYDTTYRAVSYKAYPSPSALSRTIKLGDGFSRYENMTGMYLPAGQNIIFVGDTHGKSISLLAPNFMRKPAAGIKPTEDPNGWGLHRQEFDLQEGVNLVTLKHPTNVYVSYFDDNAQSAPAIKVHFLTGQVNGYFDAAKMNNANWDSLLKNAVSPIMDARGRFIQVAYPVEMFVKHTSGKGKELMAAYDSMLYSQYKLMGLVKYEKLPLNRIFARVNFNYYMFRDGDGVAYLGDQSTMRMVADPTVVVSGDPCWGFSHEVGHVLQMQPQLTWGGMTEVSNNINSLYTSAAMGNPSRLKAQNNYNTAREAIIGKGISYLHDGDVFNRLVPFWQLNLHFTQNGFPDFYGDVMEALRSRPVTGWGDNAINNQFDFIKVVCDVTKTDLTDFFDKWGFFWTGDLTLNDYGRYNYSITPEMVKETKDYIASKNYPKPESDLTLVSE